MNEIKPISLRITDKTLYDRLQELAASTGQSLNMTTNMLLGFAFNESDRQGKTFKPIIVFDTEEQMATSSQIDNLNKILRDSKKSVEESIYTAPENTA